MQCKNSLILLFIGLITYSCCNQEARLNRQAAKDYLTPTMQGGVDSLPFWNTFAVRFLYAPSFEFRFVDGAKRYQYQALDKTGTTYSFKGSSPREPLSPIWNKLAIGQVNLTVLALDSKGHIIDTAGTRSFYRDYPFQLPFPKARSSYREVAILGLIYAHRMPQVQNWTKTGEPDLSYRPNSYPCKIIGSTILSEVRLAKEVPQLKEEALSIATAAAHWLMDHSCPENAPLAYFPPTYHPNGVLTSQNAANKGKTMTPEAVTAALAYLDLYEVTGEEQLLEHAMGIAGTYARLQREDGSLPLKMDYLTGEPVNEVCAMPTEALVLWSRLATDYEQTQYLSNIAKAEQWVMEVRMKGFDMTGQFEDVTIQGLQPYENLTHSVVTAYVIYLLSKPNPTKQEITFCHQMLRWIEDQFVYWRCDLNEYGYRRDALPGVYEQYKYRNPIDHSAASVARAFYLYHKQTGDKLALAKSVAIADNIANNQYCFTGEMPTSFRRAYDQFVGDWWMNCALCSIETLLIINR